MSVCDYQLSMCFQREREGELKKKNTVVLRPFLKLGVSRYNHLAWDENDKILGIIDQSEHVILYNSVLDINHYQFYCTLLAYNLQGGFVYVFDASNSAQVT